MWPSATALGCCGPKNGSGNLVLRVFLNGTLAINAAFLRLWGSLVRIECRFFSVLLDPAFDLRVRHRKHALHCVLESRDGFRAFNHFRLRLHCTLDDILHRARSNAHFSKSGKNFCMRLVVSIAVQPHVRLRLIGNSLKSSTAA